MAKAKGLDTTEYSPSSILIITVKRFLKDIGIDTPSSINADILTNALLEYPNFAGYKPEILKKAVLCAQKLDDKDSSENPEQLEARISEIRRQVSESLMSLD